MGDDNIILFYFYHKFSYYFLLTKLDLSCSYNYSWLTMVVQWLRLALSNGKYCYYYLIIFLLWIFYYLLTKPVLSDIYSFSWLTVALQWVRLYLPNRPNWVGTPNLITWGWKYPVSEILCSFKNTRWWTHSRNPVILIVATVYSLCVVDEVKNDWKIVLWSEKRQEMVFCVKYYNWNKCISRCVCLCVCGFVLEWLNQIYFRCFS